MNLCFIVATIEGRELYLERLFESIKISFSEFDYNIYAIRQYKYNRVSHIAGINIHNIRIFGASNARNIGIQMASESSYDFDYISFPDDDCYYDHECGNKIADLCVDMPELFFGDIRDPGDNFRMGFPVLNKTLLKYNFFSINCPSFFINSSLIYENKFNCSYGPGSVVNAVEETELLFRILINNPKCKSIYIPVIKIFHPHEVISGNKLAAYSYSQGFFFRYAFRLSKSLAIPYVLVLLRPLFGLILNIHREKFRKFYLSRIKYIWSGLNLGGSS